jgi:hypothetical protein
MSTAQIEIDTSYISEEQWLVLYMNFLPSIVCVGSMTIMQEATVDNYKEKVYETIQNELLVSALKASIDLMESENENNSGTQAPHETIEEATRVSLG